MLNNYLGSEPGKPEKGSGQTTGTAMALRTRLRACEHPRFAREVARLLPAAAPAHRDAPSRGPGGFRGKSNTERPECVASGWVRGRGKNAETGKETASRIRSTAARNLRSGTATSEFGARAQPAADRGQAAREKESASLPRH